MKIIKVGIESGEIVFTFRFRLLLTLIKKFTDKIIYEIAKWISFDKKKYLKYELKPELKDWQISKLMFGRNDKKDCEIIKKMRKHYQINYHSDGWCSIWNTNIDDEVGWLIPEECLTIKK